MLFEVKVSKSAVHCIGNMFLCVPQNLFLLNLVTFLFSYFDFYLFYSVQSAAMRFEDVYCLTE